MMMTNREVNQIKLELNKSPLDQHDMEMLHARLDAMAANHNGYMYSIMWKQTATIKVSVELDFYH